MWRAIYKDGSIVKEIVKEIDAENKEILFGSLDLEQIKIFEILLDKHVFGVSLLDAAFRFNESIFQFEGFEGEKLKLIYFKRVRKVLGSGGGDSITYNIGYQTEGSEDKPNQQRIMRIHHEGANLRIAFHVK